jgi:TetR/AcrR family hemagglutinin/protease transcriptional regulator
MQPPANGMSGKARLPPEQRRAELVQCAVAAAAEHGIARVTHSHVAKRAGVSIPAVHSYFRARVDLVEAILAEVEGFILQMIGETLSGEGTPFERLHLLATRVAQNALDKADLIVAWLDWSTSVHSPHWPRYLRLLDQAVARTADVLRQALPQGAAADETSLLAAARAYVGGGHTLALMQFARATPDELASLAQQLARSALRSQD